MTDSDQAMPEAPAVEAGTAAPPEAAAAPSPARRRSRFPRRSESARVQVFRSILALLRRTLQRGRREAGLEGAIVLLHPKRPGGAEVRDIETVATDRLSSLPGKCKLRTVSELVYRGSIAAEDVGDYIGTNITFADLKRDPRVKLVAFLIKRAIHNQRQAAPFDTTTAEEMKQMFPSWYPAAVRWVRPTSMTDTELASLYDRLVVHLRPRKAWVLDQTGQHLGIKQPAKAAQAKAVLRASFDTDAGAIGLIQEDFQSVGEQLYLPAASATGTQIMRLLNEHRMRNGQRQRKKDNFNVAGIQITFENLYNTVQSLGGYLEVAKRLALREELFARLGLTDVPRGFWKDLNKQWKTHLAPICVPTAGADEEEEPPLAAEEDELQDATANVAGPSSEPPAAAQNPGLLADPDSELDNSSSHGQAGMDLAGSMLDQLCPELDLDLASQAAGNSGPFSEEEARVTQPVQPLPQRQQSSRAQGAAAIDYAQLNSRGVLAAAASPNRPRRQAQPPAWLRE